MATGVLRSGHTLSDATRVRAARAVVPISFEPLGRGRQRGRTGALRRFGPTLRFRVSVWLASVWVLVCAFLPASDTLPGAAGKDWRRCESVLLEIGV